MLASANAKMQKPRVKRALCLVGAGKVRLRVWFVRGLSRGIRVLDLARICKGVVFALFAWFACAGDLQGV